MSCYHLENPNSNAMLRSEQLVWDLFRKHGMHSEDDGLRLKDFDTQYLVIRYHVKINPRIP